MWQIDFDTQYTYLPDSGRPPILKGIASRPTIDAEGDVIVSFYPPSVEYLRRFGKIDWNHKGTPIGQILKISTVKDSELTEYLKKSYDQSEDVINLVVEAQLYPLTPRAHPDLREAYYCIESKAKLGFSVEGKAGRIQKASHFSTGKGPKRFIYDLQLSPRIALTPTPVHPEAIVTIVKSHSNNSYIDTNVCKCGAVYHRGQFFCSRCGRLYK